jgi:hypothetical protein
MNTKSEETQQVPEALSGGCMCGAVRYKISGAPIASGLCHCNRCRPQSGSAFSTIIIIKRSTISPPDVAIDHLFPPYTPEKNAALKMWLEY